MEIIGLFSGVLLFRVLCLLHLPEVSAAVCCSNNPSCDVSVFLNHLTQEFLGSCALHTDP